LAQPSAERQNNKRLFFLARGIKALEAQAGRVWTEAELKVQVFLPWYTANPHLRPGQSQDDYWFEFLRAYDAVQYPLGETFLDRAWQAAEQTTLPQVAMQFEDPEVRQLVLWCRELQRLAGDAVFFLSTRSVQARFGLRHPMQAWRRLYGLCRAKILDPVEKGDVNGKKATRYRYLEPLDDEAGDGVADRGPPGARTNARTTEHVLRHETYERFDQCRGKTTMAGSSLPGPIKEST
jgi:hypothetical protein